MITDLWSPTTKSSYLPTMHTSMSSSAISPDLLSTYSSTLIKDKTVLQELLHREIVPKHRPSVTDHKLSYVIPSLEMLPRSQQLMKSRTISMRGISL